MPFYKKVALPPSAEKKRASKATEERFKKKISITQASISPHVIHTYRIPENGWSYSAGRKKNAEKLRENTCNGFISHKAQKRIEAGINWLLFKSKPKPFFDDKGVMRFFRINFITLTLPSKQRHEDSEIVNRCLGNFIDVIKKNEGVEDYIWRAECQPGTGNIHFHITTNKYINYKDVERYWNQSVELLGYVSEFEKKWHHRNPNSTDIKAVKHVKKLAAYIAKYMAKDKEFVPIGELRQDGNARFEILYGSQEYREEEGGKKRGKVIGSVIAKVPRRLDCKLWFCSRGISQMKPLIINQQCFQWCAIEDILEHGKFYQTQNDYVRSFYGKIFSTAQQLSPGLFEDIVKHSNGERIDFTTSDSNQLQYLQ